MEIVVLLKDSHVRKIREMVGEFKKLGLNIKKVEEKAGIITCTGAASVKVLESITGVEHARIEREEAAPTIG